MTMVAYLVFYNVNTNQEMTNKFYEHIGSVDALEYNSVGLEKLIEQLKLISKNLELLSILAKTESYVSSTNLIQLTGISRSTLLARLEKLRRAGLVEKRAGYVYKLNQSEVSRLKEGLVHIGITLPL